MIRFIAKLTVIVAGTGVGLFFLAIYLLGKVLVSEDEVARVNSPSGNVDAILIETNGGATTSFGYEIYVVPTGSSTKFKREVASLYGAVRSEQAYGVNLVWEEPSVLVGEYLEARYAEVLSPSRSVAGEQIEIRLRDGINDPDAPPGGMLYNQQGRPYD